MAGPKNTHPPLEREVALVSIGCGRGCPHSLHPNPAQVNSALVRSVAHGITHLQWIMRELVYKPLNFSLSIQCGTKKQRQNEGNSSFPSKTKYTSNKRDWRVWAVELLYLFWRVCRGWGRWLDYNLAELPCCHVFHSHSIAQLMVEGESNCRHEEWVIGWGVWIWAIYMFRIVWLCNG